MLIVALLLAIGADHGRAQSPRELSIDAWGTALTSDKATLKDGAGAGLGIAMGIAGMEWLAIGVALTQLRSDSERDGLACRTMTPFPAGCEPDRLMETVTIRSLRLTVQPRWELTRHLSVAGGLGVTMNELSIDSQGIETDLIGNLYSAPSAHMGALLDLGVAWSPFPYLPLDLVVGATNHWIHFDGCRSHPDMFAPYCGATSLMVLRAGLSFGIQL